MSDGRVTAVGEATSLADRKRRAGQRLLIGISGAAPSDDERRLIAEIGPAGFVLFARNVVEPGQVRELNRELASLVSPYHPALLAVDQEGGRVQRIGEPATVWPAMREVGRSDRTADVSRAMARELRAMGFNTNFAPVTDVDSNPDNPVIGDRSFGRDPATVGAHAAAFVTAHQAEGLIACAKHFPGHGDTDVDSHLDLPRVERDEPDLRACELVPFDVVLGAGVATVMSSHVVYPCWDEELPATLSSRVIPRLLRQERSFDGIVFSDDMEMKAVCGRYEVADQVLRATEASVDVLLVCRSPTRQYETYQALVRVQEVGRAHDQAATDVVGRLQRLRERFFLRKLAPPDPAWIGHPEHRLLAALVRERGAS